MRRYQTGSLKSRKVHLTNYSVNKNGKDFVKGANGSKRSLKPVMDLLKDRGIDVDKMWSNIIYVIVASILSVHHQLARAYKAAIPEGSTLHTPSSTCFEILGFDVLLDANQRAWLIEVNHAPSFKGGSKVDTSVKSGVIRRAFDILKLSQRTKRKLSGRVRKQWEKYMHAQAGLSPRKAAAEPAAGGKAGCKPATPGKAPKRPRSDTASSTASTASTASNQSDVSLSSCSSSSTTYSASSLSSRPLGAADTRSLSSSMESLSLGGGDGGGGPELLDFRYGSLGLAGGKSVLDCAEDMGVDTISDDDDDDDDVSAEEDDDREDAADPIMVGLSGMQRQPAPAPHGAARVHHKAPSKLDAGDYTPIFSMNKAADRLAYADILATADMTRPGSSSTASPADLAANLA